MATVNSEERGHEQNASTKAAAVTLLEVQCQGRVRYECLGARYKILN